VSEKRTILGGTPSVLFTGAESLQPAFVNLVLNAVISSETVHGFLHENSANSGQPFASLKQLLGMLLAFFARNLDGALKNAPHNQSRRCSLRRG
tara:strand:- start:501 stop:782 length:282 start_codon:yes stop_codon:yes gene_type:complete